MGNLKNKKTNVLVAGCSYTGYMDWPEHLFADSNVTNIGKWGCGNEFIANRVMHTISKEKTKPDFVFMLFTGLHRIDMRCPSSEFLKNNENYFSEDVGHSKYFLSGGCFDVDQPWLESYNKIKDPSWPKIKSMKDWANLPDDIKLECVQSNIMDSYFGRKCSITTPIVDRYFLIQHIEKNSAYYCERSFQSISNVCDFLKVRNIPYRFSFIYDLKRDYGNRNYALGKLKKEVFYDQVDWNKFIYFPAYDYGIKHDLLDTDTWHLTQEGMIQWASELKDKLRFNEIIESRNQYAIK